VKKILVFEYFLVIYATMTMHDEYSLLIASVYGLSPGPSQQVQSPSYLSENLWAKYPKVNCEYSNIWPLLHYQ